MSASIDSTTLGYLVGRYHDRNVLLFEVAPQMLPHVDGEWTGPLALRLQREEGRMVEIEIFDLRGMFEEGWNGRIDSKEEKREGE